MKDVKLAWDYNLKFGITNSLREKRETLLNDANNIRGYSRPYLSSEQKKKFFQEFQKYSANLEELEVIDNFDEWSKILKERENKVSLNQR